MHLPPPLFRHVHLMVFIDVSKRMKRGRQVGKSGPAYLRGPKVRAFGTFCFLGNVIRLQFRKYTIRNARTFLPVGTPDPRALIRPRKDVGTRIQFADKTN